MRLYWHETPYNSGQESSIVNYVLTSSTNAGIGQSSNRNMCKANVCSTDVCGGWGSEMLNFNIPDPLFSRKIRLGPHY